MKHILYFSLFYILASNVFGKLAVVQHVELKTRFATLLGTLETVITNFNTHNSSREAGIETSYYAFRGIPYAEPPTGELRWKDPILKLPLGNNLLFDATVEKNQCPQWIIENGTSVLLGDENCLYASVFIPVENPAPYKSSLKIMVFFHGGGFIVNANRNTLPIPFLAQKNTIVVMFNYRISIFGYLSTGTTFLPGNYAFLDQITLLKWIQLYGRDFGGDPNDVTIFGSSTGSVSIHYLLLSKRSMGLFHKAIMESGSAFCERSLVPTPLETSIKLGRLLQCSDIYNQRLLVSCLKSKSMLELMMAAKHLTAKWTLPSILGPVIDNNSRPPKYQFLTDFPEKLSVINKVPVIVGITKDEGLNAFVKLSKDYNWENLHDLDFIEEIILPQYLNLILRSRKSNRQTFINNLSNEVLNFYRNDFAKDTISTLIEILGDLWINTCHMKTLEHLCKNVVPSVYSYIFTQHDEGISPSNIDADILAFRENGIDHSILRHGTAHTEEILYLLEAEQHIFSVKDNRLVRFLRNKIMSDILSTVWTHFAISRSDVNRVPSINGWPKWNPVCYSIDNQSFVNPEYPLYEISLDSHKIFSNYRLQETQFWWKRHQETGREQKEGGRSY